ncbi:MAG: Tfp pilus assembly protein FimT/FimU [Myxococcota bacterium]
MNRETQYHDREQARRRSQGGFSLLEIAIVLALIGILTAVAIPNVSRTIESGRGKAAAKSVADAFNFARAQAIRSGNNQIVFFSAGGAGDVAGNTLTSADGTAVPILVLDDGAPGSANQDCDIDAGEERVGWGAQRGVGWGANRPGSTDVAPDDPAASIPASGANFFAPNGTTAVTWVMFRPDGVPVAIDSACTVGRLGTGGGTIYIWTENRDFAITLSPLGASRVHTWDRNAGAWTS